MSEHARLAPSSAARWTACPGSVAAERNLPDRAGEAAERGTAAHELLELGVYATQQKQGCAWPTMSNGVTLDAEDVAAVRLAEKTIEDRGYDFYFSEVRVPIGDALGRDDCWGTGDVVGRKDDLLEGIDYKHGSGISVEVTENLQLLLYLIGARLMPDMEGCTEFASGVIQPRKDHEDGPIRFAPALSSDELDEWVVWFRHRAAATDDPNAPRIPGEVQCQWCKARGTCPELAKMAMGKTLAVFDGVSMEVDSSSLLRAPETLTAEQVATILDNRALITAWLKAVSEDAMSRAQAGALPPGYKLVAGRKSKSYVKDEDVVEKKVRGMKTIDGVKIKKAQVTKTTLLSPAQLLKTMKPLVSEKTFASVESLIAVNEGAPTLAPITDRRKSLPSKVDAAFGHIPEIQATKKGKDKPTIEKEETAEPERTISEDALAALFN